MESPSHSLNLLFEQLGLDSNDEAIDMFINKHKSIHYQGFLYEADFWSRSQADFLKQSVDEDADWAIVVDQLDSMLR